jgi:bifunctional DNA-binding transcriptional regulator/antitoxin component of YhaV-PrlF toxin-antitoxin module
MEITLAVKGFREQGQASYEGEEALRSLPYANLKIDSAGRVVVPAEMRAAMLAKPGDVLTAWVVEGELRVVSRAVVMRRIRDEAKRFKAAFPGVSIVDELISERREEARKELEEANAWRRAHGLPPFDAE